MSILVVAAHPDDEILGCGGVMARHVAEGETVHVLIAAEGTTSRDDSRDASSRSNEISALCEAANSAAQIIGTQPPRFCGLADNRLNELSLLDIVKIIEKMISDVQPSVVYTHHAGDLNVDHQVIHQASITACRPLPGSPVKEIYTYEVASSTEWGGAASLPAFIPQTFIDISPYLDAKKKALDAYAMEMRPFPHARSIEAVEAMARVRGAQSGLVAAEAFKLVLAVR